MRGSEIKKYEFKSGLIQGFEFVDIEWLFKEYSNLITKPHRAGFYHVLWFQKGATLHWVDFMPIQIRPNTLLFLNKDIVHCFDKSGHFEGKAVLFTDDFYNRTETDTQYLRSNILFNDLFSVPNIELDSIPMVFTQLFDQMENEVNNPKDSYQPEILHNLLNNVFLYSERIKRNQNFIEVKKGVDLDLVILFRELLDRQYRKQNVVGYYSDQLHITQKRLNQATLKVLDKSPKQMIMERILLEAKRLLAHTNESVKEIGFELGFEEPTNFIKYFRKHHHLTPIQFRRSFF